MGNADYQIEVNLGQNLYIEHLDYSAAEIIALIEAQMGNDRLDLEKLRNVNAETIAYGENNHEYVKSALDALFNPTSIANLTAFVNGEEKPTGGFLVRPNTIINIEDRSLLLKTYFKYVYTLDNGANIIATFNQRNPSFSIANSGVYNLHLHIRKPDGTLIALTHKFGYITVGAPTSPPGINIKFDIQGNTQQYGTQPIPGATIKIEFAGSSDYQQFATNGIGESETQLIAGTYTYIISAEKFETVTGTITVEEESQEISVVLDETTNELTVSVIDEGGSPLVGAAVLLTNGNSTITNESGNAVFSNLPIATYGYIVSMVGYTTESGSVYVDEDTTVETEIEILTAIYKITFHVTDQDVANVANASILLESSALGVEQTLQTGIDGIAEFETLEQGTYDYTITKEGYDDETGTVTIVDADVSEDVTINEIVIPSIYMGYLTEAQDIIESGVISDAIVLGTEYSANHSEIDTSTGQDNFPDELNVRWAEVFSLSGYDLHRFWFSVPVSRKSELYELYEIGIIGGISVAVNFDIEERTIDGVLTNVYVRKNIGAATNNKFYSD